MAAPKGNQFWNLRSLKGREKLFASPELLWEAACEYFKWCDENPLTSQEWVGKDGDEVTRNHPRPYTIHGLCGYLDCSTDFIRHFKARLAPDDQAYRPIITRIEDIIYRQKFEGASVGHFNANIIARDLGLTDKKELDVPGGIQITIKEA